MNCMQWKVRNVLKLTTPGGMDYLDLVKSDEEEEEDIAIRRTAPDEEFEDRKEKVVPEVVSYPSFREDTEEDILDKLIAEKPKKEQLVIPDWLAPLLPPDVMEVPDHYLSPDDDSSCSEEPPPRNKNFIRRLRYANLNDYNPAYWKCRKIIKFIRCADENGMAAALAMLAEMDLENEENKYGIVDPGGHVTLVNLLSMKNIKLQLWTINILKRVVTDHEIMQEMLVSVGLLESLYPLLSHPNLEMRHAAVDLIHYLSNYKPSRAIARKSLGLAVLVEMVDELDDKIFKLKKLPPKNMNVDEAKLYDIRMLCLTSIANLNCSKKVRSDLLRLGFVPILKKLIYSPNEMLYNMGIQIVFQSATLPVYHSIYKLDGFLPFIWQTYLQKGKNELTLMKTIYKLLDDKECKQYLMKKELLKTMCNNVRKQDGKLLKYSLKILARYVNIAAHRAFIDQQDMVLVFLRLLDHSNTFCRGYAGYLLGQLSRFEHNKEIIDKSGGITQILNYLRNSSDFVLLEHATKVLCDCAFYPPVFEQLASIDIIHTLWSLTTLPAPRVQENACSALVPFIGTIKDSEEQVRCFPGGFYKLVSLMDHKEDGTKAGAITALSRIAYNDENFHAIRRFGFVDKLFKLTDTTHPRLRYAIGLGLASAGRTDETSFKLGKRGAINTLTNWARSDEDTYALIGIITGLWKLSYEPINCLVLHKSHIVERMISLLKRPNKTLHQVIAGLLSNLRRLAREAEYRRNVHQPHPPEPSLGSANQATLIEPFQYPDDPPQED